MNEFRGCDVGIIYISSATLRRLSWLYRHLNNTGLHIPAFLDNNDRYLLSRGVYNDHTEMGIQGWLRKDIQCGFCRMLILRS